MLEKELKVLKSFIDKHFKKGLIRALTSLAASLVLFVLKKDRSLQLYVDY